MTDTTVDERRVLVLAPRGRDAAVIVRVLARSDLAAEIVPDVSNLLARLSDGAFAVIATEEALPPGEVEPLFAWLDSQPPWSDLPVVLLSTKRMGKRSTAAATTIDRLGNVVLLERPVNAETLTEAARSALRARRRQYQARAHLIEREKAQRSLRVVNATLERRVEARTRALEAARETLSFALDSAGMGSWDLDLVHGTSRRSTQHDHIFGLTTAPVAWGLGELLDHVVDDDREVVRQAWSSALVNARLDLECRIRRPIDGVRWIALKGRVDYDEAGRPIRMAGVVLDRTEQRITEDELRQAQKMDAVGQLTGGVAHDFNNLLTVIIGGLDMIVRRPDKQDRVKRLAEAVMAAARRGELLTQQLLAFSRRQILRPQTVDANRLLQDVRVLAARAAGAAITLRFDLDPDLDPIKIDPTQFQSAVLNLVVNARDALAAGREDAAVTVRSRNVRLDTTTIADRGLQASDYVEIAVVDNGAGIAPDIIHRVFEPFFTTKDIGKGTGLGLSQVYGFARSAQGFATIESAVEAGTTVRLLFPRSQEAVPPEAVAPSCAAMALRSAADGETVLLVEDDEQVLGMAMESLEELRYRVVMARNAAEALKHLRGDQRIDVMFSDVMMPGGMNGTQLAAEARRLRPGIKVLLTSGYVANLDGEQGFPHRETSVLSKPYRRDELARSLRIVLGNEHDRPIDDLVRRSSGFASEMQL